MMIPTLPPEVASFDATAWQISAKLKARSEAAEAKHGKAWVDVSNDPRKTTLAKGEDLERICAELSADYQAADRAALAGLRALHDEVSRWAHKPGAAAVDISQVETKVLTHVSFALASPSAAKAVWALWRNARERREPAEVRAWQEMLPTLQTYEALRHPVIGETGGANTYTAIELGVQELREELKTREERQCDAAREHLSLEEVKCEALWASRPGPLETLHNFVRRAARMDAHNALLDKMTGRAFPSQ